MQGGFTPSHSGSGDVWRPGGDSNDLDVVKTEDSEVSSTWGAASATSDSLFGNSTSTSVDGGWGTSAQGGSSTWGQTTNEDNNLPSNDDSNNDSSSQNPTFNSTEDNVLSEDAAPVWFMDRVCIELKSGPHKDSEGVIKDTNVSNKTATIELLQNGAETITARANELKLVDPKEHDMVLVTGGADVGVEGELVCIDGSDAILKDTNEDFKIVDFSHLAKIVNE